MRYQPALVLSTLAVGQAAAANHRHASFHARRSANVAGPEGVEWNKVVRDAVDYDAAIKAANIDQAQWDAIFASQNGQAAPTTAAAAPAEQKAAPTPAPEPVKSEPKPESKAADKPSSTSQAEAKATKAASSGGSGNVLETLGCSQEKKGTSGSKIWVGDSGSKTQFTFTNDADEDSAVFCWDFEGMFDPKNKAIVAVGVGAGSSITLSVAPSFSGGCGPAYKDSGFHNPSGILNESILEFTTAPEVPDIYVTGVYDDSKEVNMDGVVMSATGNRKCTSGVLNGAVSCLFGCVGGAKSCEATGTYGITAGNDASGMCNVGVDTNGNGGASGGCQFNPDGDHVKITYSTDRNWPAPESGSY